MTQTALTAGFLAILFAAQYVISRYRRTLPIYAEWKTFKSKLPASVQTAERIIQFVLLIVLTVLFVVGLFLSGVIASHGNENRISQAFAVITISSFVMAWPLAALCANGISYIFPAMRKANLNAFNGLQVASLRRANLELMLLFLGCVALCLPIVLVAMLAPWMR